MRALKVFVALTAAIQFAVTSPASAGAWARDKGKVFTSFSGFATWPAGRPFELPDVYASGYAEYGLGRKLTLAFEAGTPDYEDMDRFSATISLRYTLSAPEATDQFAVEIGGGVDQGRNVVRAGLSYGRGFSLNSKSGWVAIDAALRNAMGTQAQDFKVDATAGVNLSQSKLMLQVSAHKSYSGAQSVTLTPSFVHAFGARTHVEVGVVFGLKGKPDPALKLGIWQEF